jgi:hypothetical protein
MIKKYDLDKENIAAMCLYHTICPCFALGQEAAEIKRQS